MTNKKKSFLLHIDSLDILDDLTDEQAGLLFKAIKKYKKEEPVELDQIVKMVFLPFKNQFDRDNEKYLKTCEKRAIAGSKGGKQKLANASKCKQDLANVADSDNKNKNKTNNKSDNKDILSLINDGFLHWWNLYPVSRRKNKGGCLEKFKVKCKKLTEDEIIELINKISSDIDYRIKNTEDVKFIPMTEPYMNQERWLDRE